MLTYIASNYEEATKYSSIILNQNPIMLGLDTETTVWRKDNPTYPSTIQLYLNGACYIFQIYKIFMTYQAIPKDLFKILKNPNIIKVGLDLNNDIEQLALYEIKVRGIIDIQCIAKTMLIADISLEGLANKFETQTKGIFKFKWDWDDLLIDEQIAYASIDAMLPIKIYERMMNGSIIIKSNTIDDHNLEADYLAWLKLMGHTSNLKIKKVVNQTVNSYAPWRKQYTESERSALSLRLLKEFLDKGLL